MTHPESRANPTKKNQSFRGLLASASLTALCLTLTACFDRDPRATPEATIESAVALVKERRLEECAEQYLTPDFHWGNRDQKESIARIRRYLDQVDELHATIQDLETKQTTDIDAKFQLTALVGLTLSEKSDFEGLPVKGLRFDVEGELRWTQDGWRIATFTIRDR